MPSTVIDGITTRYEVAGSGPPLLMFSPGGFNAQLANWSSFGVYSRLKLLDQLTQHYTCITYDRREAGESGGRVERVTWADYANQGRGLLDHLGIDQAHVMGGCAGCSVAVAFGTAYPERTRSMVLYWPAGGVKYRLKQHARFTQHLAYAASEGLAAVAALATSSTDSFTTDGRVGPWVTVLRTDPQFAAEYVTHDPQRYQQVVTGMARTLFDRDTAPGAEPEDLLTLDTPTLVIPGEDDSHAPSAARYLQECLPASEYWDTPVADQNQQTVSTRVLQFLEQAEKK